MRKEQERIPKKRNRVNIRKRKEWRKIKRNGTLQNKRLEEEDKEDDDEEEDRKQMKKMTEKEVG